MKLERAFSHCHTLTAFAKPPAGTSISHARFLASISWKFMNLSIHTEHSSLGAFRPQLAPNPLAIERPRALTKDRAP
jgi:hypothetical protein